MKVFCHHLYEYKRGLRNLILHTTGKSNQEAVEKRLSSEGIAYIVSPVTENKINVFFGNSTCMEILASFPSLSLSGLTHEQDFILGIMLGYDRMMQCSRYVKRKNNGSSPKTEELIG